MGEDEVYKRALQLKKIGAIKKVLTHHQILSLMIENLLIDQNFSELIISDKLNDFRKCIIRMSDFLEKDLYPTKTTSSRDVAIGALFRNFYFNSSTITCMKKISRREI